MLEPRQCGTPWSGRACGIVNGRTTFGSTSGVPHGVFQRRGRQFSPHGREPMARTTEMQERTSPMNKVAAVILVWILTLVFGADSGISFSCVVLARDELPPTNEVKLSPGLVLGLLHFPLRGVQEEAGRPADPLCVGR